MLTAAIMCCPLAGFRPQVGFSAPISAAAADQGGRWIVLGLVADIAGSASQWRDEPGFVFAGGASKPDRVPKVGDRLQLTVVKALRTTNAQGQRPFEREVTNQDTVGELPVGAIVQVLEIGRRSMSKAGDRWQCWVRVNDAARKP